MGDFGAVIAGVLCLASAAVAFRQAWRGKFDSPTGVLTFIYWFGGSLGLAVLVAVAWVATR